MEVLTRCRHNGFPVVRGAPGDENDDEDSGDFDAAGLGASRAGSLQGIILRSQILVMLRHQVHCPGTAHRLCLRQKSYILRFADSMCALVQKFLFPFQVANLHQSHKHWRSFSGLRGPKINESV